MQYFDKDGREIKAGMKLLMEDGSIEMVYDTVDSYANRSMKLSKDIRTCRTFAGNNTEISQSTLSFIGAFKHS